MEWPGERAEDIRDGQTMPSKERRLMRVGLQVPSFTWPNGQSQLGDTFAHIAREAERAGFYSLWVMDHFFQLPNLGPVDHEMLEGWTTLGFAAGVTNRIKLGTLVTGVTYRHPAILVKTATTLDVLSHGRAYFGIGAAWNEEEHVGLGVPFPPRKERFERLEEALRLAHQMWEGNQQPFEGKHYQAQRPLNSPQSVQRPHPPIMIGGGGEQKTLRLVAQYADACNLFGRIGTDELRRKLEVLQEHCRQVGRPYEEIEKTTLNTIYLSSDAASDTTSPLAAITMTPQAAVEYCAQQAAMGFDQAIFNMPNVSDPAVFDLFGHEVIPAVEQLAIAGR
jgi:F420-dependent oxidoreductase-like protein